jgi:outer membrane lipoprotein-sorting protein
MVWHYHAGFDRITVLKGDKAKGACAAALAAGIDIESFFNLHEAGAGSGRPWMLGMAKDGHPSLFESVRIDFRDGNLQAAEFRDIFGQVLQIRFSSQNYDPVMDRNLFIFIPPVRAE